MKAKRILCLALTLMLMLSLGMVTAYAEGETTTTMVEPDDFDTAGFSKILWIAEGLPLTGIDIGNNTTADINAFTFSFTGRVSDTVTDETVIPAIANKTVTVGTDRQGDYTTGTLTYQAIFGDAPGPSTVDFPHAGEYIYTVREVAPNPAINNIVLGEEPNTVTKNLDAAADAYNLHIYVANDGADLKYTFIILKRAEYSTETSRWEDTGEKLDPTIVTQKIVETDTNTYAISNDFRFVNKYTEVIKNGTAGTGVLKVAKTITGEYADKTKTFPVSVEFHIPSTALATVTNDVAVAGTTAQISPALSTSVQDYTVSDNLADGDTIVFTSLPAGTTFTVKETQSSPYKSKVTGFVEAPDTEYQSGNVSKGGGGYILEDEKAVAIENNLNIPPVTGIIIENLPYVLLAAVGVLGILFLVLKRIKKKAE